MVKFRGMNVPPELARDVNNLIERRVGDTSGIAGKRRTTGGLSRGGREAVNDAFLESVTCWHMQTIPAKEDWYRRSQQSGMRYYNFFMGQTIGEFYHGRIPDWCTALQDGLLQIPGNIYDGDNLFDPGIFSTGQRIYLEITLAWSNLKEWDSLSFTLMLQTWEYNFLQLGFRIEGGASCVDLVEDEISDPSWGDYYKTGIVTGSSSYPVTFTISADIPSFYDVNNINDSRVVLNMSSDTWGLPDNEYPVAWVYHALVRAGTEIIYENNYGDDNLQPVEVDRNIERTFLAMPNPWSVWGFGNPVCTFGEVE